MGQGAPSRRHHGRIESGQDQKSKVSKREAKPNDNNTTEYMAQRNLDPVVPHQEEAEYEGYASYSLPSTW